MSSTAHQIRYAASAAPVVSGAQYYAGSQPAAQYAQPYSQPSVMYVDEAGRPVDMNQYQQQVQQYVDQYGNPCDEHGNPVGNVEYVDQYGNPCDEHGNPVGDVQYVDQYGNPCDERGNPVGNVQYVDQYGNPCDEHGNPVGVAFGAPQNYGQPSTYSVSPEVFAKLSQGGAMSQQEINLLLGGTSAPVTSQPHLAVPAVTFVEPAGLVTGAATASAKAVTVSDKKKKDKKESSKVDSNKKSSKKSKKSGCC